MISGTTSLALLGPQKTLVATARLPAVFFAFFGQTRACLTCTMSAVPRLGRSTLARIGRSVHAGVWDLMLADCPLVEAKC